MKKLLVLALALLICPIAPIAPIGCKAVCVCDSSGSNCDFVFVCE